VPKDTPDTLPYCKLLLYHESELYTSVARGTQHVLEARKRIRVHSSSFYILSLPLVEVTKILDCVKCWQVAESRSITQGQLIALQRPTLHGLCLRQLALVFVEDT
jgi:hypothetical protein